MEPFKICSLLSLTCMVLAALFFLASIPNTWSKGESTVDSQKMMMTMPNGSTGDSSKIMNMFGGFMGGGSNSLGDGDLGPFGGLDTVEEIVDAEKAAAGKGTDPFEGMGGFGGLAGLEKSSEGKNTSKRNKSGASDTSPPITSGGSDLDKMMKGVQIKVEMEYSLHKLCFNIKYEMQGMPASVKKMIGKTSEEQCTSFSTMKKFFKTIRDTSVRSKMEDGLKKIDATLACIITAAVFTILALLVAVIKTPCIKFPRKDIIVFVTAACCVVAALVGIAGIALFDIKVYKKDVSGFEAGFKHRSINFNHSKELSFILASLGEALLLIALFITIAEAFMKKQKQYTGEDTYKILERQVNSDMPDEA